MRLSRLARHAWTSALGALPGTLILFWIRLEHGHELFIDSYALLTAWVIQGVMIFAFLGEGGSAEKKPAEGTTDPLLARDEILAGFSWFGCLCGWRYMMPFANGSVDCPECGTTFDWTDFGRTSIVGHKVTTSWGGAYAVRSEPNREVNIEVQSEEGENGDGD